MTQQRSDQSVRRSLLTRYLLTFTLVVTLPLLIYGLVSAFIAYREQREALAAIQDAQAAAAAARILQFLNEAEMPLAWMTALAWTESSSQARRLDALRALRLTPALTDIVLLDGRGRERVAESRLELSRLDSLADRSASPAFAGAVTKGRYHGDVTFRKGSEPFMTIALAGSSPEHGVAIAEVSLKHIWNVVSNIRIGHEGIAYVVDRGGRLIAHPDISLVLRNTELAANVAAFEAQSGQGKGRQVVQLIGTRGKPALASSAVIAPMGWRVIIEQPQDEADQPMRTAVLSALWAAGGSLLLALGAALWSALRLVRPLRELTVSAARVGAGQLDHRIELKTGDELQLLGEQFNRMAGELQTSYGSLESKVQERTRELLEANRAKSRLLSAASHDLRQPLHALNLLTAQLRVERDGAERERLAQRVESAIGAINGMFDGLLDVARLDAGVVQPEVMAFAVQRILDRMDVTSSAAARERGLELRIRPHAAWILSDPLLLERIVGNLVGNAIRYTRQGAVLVGCRHEGQRLRICVWDTGLGIEHDKQGQIFEEFYQVGPAGTTRQEGLGLGLSIVRRLSALLGHGVSLRSEPGRGSCFSVSVTTTNEQPVLAGQEPEVPGDELRHRRVLVIDNSEAVLRSTAGLLRSWGCQVQALSSVCEWVAHDTQTPDVVIADLQLDSGEDGVSFVQRLRLMHGAGVPAVIVTGSVSAQSHERVAEAGMVMMQKPVTALRLRTCLTRLLQGG